MLSLLLIYQLIVDLTSILPLYALTQKDREQLDGDTPTVNSKPSLHAKQTKNTASNGDKQ
ncbi:hypothetical protein AT251_19100 [Enterovibrio nigricans]|nr:hypothetical protein AT251_19100 [Enterovibrio nigricans]